MFSFPCLLFRDFLSSVFINFNGASKLCCCGMDKGFSSKYNFSSTSRLFWIPLTLKVTRTSTYQYTGCLSNCVT